MTFPQEAHMATGSGVQCEAFRERCTTVLQRLATALRPARTIS